MNNSKNTGLVVGIIGLTILIFVGLIWLVVRAPSSRSGSGIGQVEDVSFQDGQDPFIGPADAKVVVHVYSDFQCPACKFAEPAIKGAMEAYKDRVRFIWKDFPLEQLHPNARAAANAARCAAMQEKFWEYHDVLFASQDDWAKMSDPSNTFKEHARVIGLQEEAFESCRLARTQNDQVSKNVSEGLANRVDRTPTVFINNRRFFSLTTEQWTKELETALEKVSGS